MPGRHLHTGVGSNRRALQPVNRLVEWLGADNTYQTVIAGATPASSSEPESDRKAAQDLTLKVAAISAAAEGRTIVTMADLLRARIEQCPEHPTSKLKAELERHRRALAEVGRLMEEADGAINRHRGSLRRREQDPGEEARTTIHHGAWKALAEFGESLKDEAGEAPAMEDPGMNKQPMEAVF